MAQAFNKFDVFVTDLAAGVHANALNADTDVLKVALTNTLPVATNTILANITQISGAGGYAAADAANVAVTATGTITLDGTDVVFTATGAAFDTFRYAVLFNDTPTSPADPLIGWFDNGSAVDLADGQSFTVQWGANILTVS